MSSRKKTKIKVSNLKEHPNFPKLIVDHTHSCWNTENMFYLEFFSDIYSNRRYTKKILSNAPDNMLETWLLEQQINELISNAIIHGNKKKEHLLVKVHYNFHPIAKIIVEDEGEGFVNLEEWNQFNLERNKVFLEKDMKKMIKYACFKTKTQNLLHIDGGNSLFAAVEYWNKGMIYNQQKNKVCAMRDFRFRDFDRLH